MITQFTAPRKNVMIGLTHSKDGLRIVSDNKVIKVGIGLPRGKAVDLFVDTEGYWNVRQGNAVAGKLDFKTVARVKTRHEAEVEFRKAYEAADLCGYPRKVPYFVFTRPIMGRDGAEVYVPDFDATEAYSFADPKRPGPPTEIDIMFLSNDPYAGNFAMWSASELRCTGDGEHASRSVLMYDEEKKVPEQMREAWKTAKAAGQRTFLIENGCWACDCPFSKEVGIKPSLCKPSGDLRFQLLKNVRAFGGTAFFHSGGWKTIRQLFSAVEGIKDLTDGKIYGAPLRMIVRSHVTNHLNKRAIQQNVSLGPRPEDRDMWSKLIERAWQARATNGLPEPTTKMIEAAPSDDDMGPVMSAEAMANEYYIDQDDEPQAETAITNSPVTQAASAAKVAEIGEKLAEAAKKAGAGQASGASGLAQAAMQHPGQTAPSGPSVNVLQMPPQKDVAPWMKEEKPRVAMQKLFSAMAQHDAIGKSEFDRILAKHKLEWAKAQPEAEQSLAAYREMEAVLLGKATADSQEQQAPVEEKALF